MVLSARVSIGPVLCSPDSEGASRDVTVQVGRTWSPGVPSWMGGLPSYGHLSQIAIAFDINVWLYLQIIKCRNAFKAQLIWLGRISWWSLHRSEAAWITMTPPPPMSCSATNCTFATPQIIPTYELIVRTLEIHQQTVYNSQSEAVKTEKTKN